MNKSIRYMQNYLLIGLPFVVLCMIVYTVNPDPQSQNIIFKLFYRLLPINLMFWFLSLISFLILLVCMPSIRERTLSRLANINEKDEREKNITRNAYRVTYISTLAITILFLFLSMFSVSLEKLPLDQQYKNHKHPYILSVSVGFSLLDKSQLPVNPNVVFNTKDYTPSASAFLILLFIYQLASFNLSARKEKLA